MLPSCTQTQLFGGVPICLVGSSPMVPFAVLLFLPYAPLSPQHHVLAAPSHGRRRHYCTSKPDYPAIHLCTLTPTFDPFTYRQKARQGKAKRKTAPVQAIEGRPQVSVPRNPTQYVTTDSPDDLSACHVRQSQGRPWLWLRMLSRCIDLALFSAGPFEFVFARFLWVPYPYAICPVSTTYQLSLLY